MLPTRSRPAWCLPMRSNPLTLTLTPTLTLTLTLTPTLTLTLTLTLTHPPTPNQVTAPTWRARRRGYSTHCRSTCTTLSAGRQP